MESTAAAEVKVNEITNLVYVRGRGRLPSDVGSELLDVLGDVCRIAVCDLNGLAPASVSSILRALAPASRYVSAWQGTALVFYVPDSALREVVFRAFVGERVLVPASLVTGTIQARVAVPRLQSVTALLPPWPQAAAEARRIALSTVTNWRMDDLTESCALVVTELVTNAIVHARTPLELTMVRAGDQVRLAVRDRGGGRAPSDPDNPCGSSLNGRGLVLVEAFSGGWGVLPARRCGKTVWAVLERAPGRAPAVSQPA